MNKYPISVLNGKYTFTIEAANEQQAMFKAADMIGQDEKIRSFLQGADFFTTDEIEGRLRSIFTGNPYEEERDRIRASIEEYEQRKPFEAMGLNVAGATVPAYLSRGLTAPAQGASLLSKARNLAGIGAVEGALAGYGASTSDTLTGNLKDTAIGAGIGSLGSMGGGAIVSLFGNSGKKFSNYVRTKMGERASTAVEQRLRDMVARTGKSEEEILADIADGRIMGDNTDLFEMIKSFIVEGGQSGKQLLEGMQTYTAGAKQKGRDALSQGLDQGNTRNLITTQAEAQKELTRLAKQLYTRAYKRSGVPSQEMMATVEDIATRFPSAMDEINAIAKASGLPALMEAGEDGTARLTRELTAEDAEMAYRGIRDITKSYFDKNRGQMGTIAGEAKDKLQAQIDAEMPEIARVRAFYKGRKGQQAAFEQGQKLFNQDPDVLANLLPDMPETAVNAMRQGFLQAIRRRLQTESNFANLANENKNIGKIMRMLLKPEDLDSVVKQLQATGEAVQLTQKLPNMAGSQTATLGRAMGQTGIDTAQDIAGSFGLDPQSLIRLTTGLINRAKSGLTEQERQVVVQTLLSDDPEFVRKMLNGQVDPSTVLGKIESVLGLAGQSVRMGVTQQAATSDGAQ